MGVSSGVSVVVMNKTRKQAQHHRVCKMTVTTQSREREQKEQRQQLSKSIKFNAHTFFSVSTRPYLPGTPLRQALHNGLARFSSSSRGSAH